MSDKIDWCRFFADIEADPKAKTPQITIRQLFEAREHVQGCDVCNNRVERTLAKAPKEQFPRQGQN